MKKVLILFICLIAMPLIVKADMSAPSFYEYQAIVTVKGGINKTNSDCNVEIPYGEEVTVYFENGDYSVISNGGDSCEVKSKYLTAMDIDLESILEDEPEKYLFEGSAVTLYKGPSKVFGIEKDKFKIPYGSILDVYYNDGTFAYIKYNDVAGWIYICDTNYMCPYGEVDDFLAAETEYEIIVFSKTNIKDFNGNVIGNVPRNKVLTTSYVGTKAYVTYDGTLGYVDGNYYTYEYYHKDDRNILTLKDMKITIDGKNITIPKGTTLKILFNTYDFESGENEYESYEIYSKYYQYLVDDGKNYGWVNDISNNDSFVILFDTNKKVTLKEDVTIYSDMNGNKITGLLPKNTEVTAKYYRINNINFGYDLTNSERFNIMIYIEGPKMSGWVKTTIDDKYINEIIESDGNEEPQYWPIVNPSPISPQSGSEDTKNHTSMREIALYSVFGAFLGALLTFVTIKLINKGRN